MGKIVAVLCCVLDMIILIFDKLTMACVVPSRFAKLKIVEDDFMAAKAKSMKLQARKEAEIVSSTKVEIPDTKKKSTKSLKSHSKMSPPPAPEGTGAGPGAGDAGWQVKKKRRTPGNNAQWEEWKERDSLMLDGNFQDDMQQALLLSKMEFEAQKKVLKLNKDPPADGERAPPAATKKQKKARPQPPQPPQPPPCPPQEVIVSAVDVYSPPGPPGCCGGAEPSPELREERVPPSNEEIQGSQLRAALDESRAETGALRAELDTLRAELLKVKTRNKKLCNIIGQGEMKDKAQVLVETENLREVQAELNAEVAALNATLQQERSRCSCGNRQDKRLATKIKKVTFHPKTAS